MSYLDDAREVVGEDNDGAQRAMAYATMGLVEQQYVANLIALCAGDIVSGHSRGLVTREILSILGIKSS